MNTEPRFSLKSPLNIAIYLSILFMVLMWLNSIFQGQIDLSEGLPYLIGILLSIVVTLGLDLFLLMRKNWARQIYIVLSILFLPFSAVALEGGSFDYVLSLVSHIVSSVLVFMLLSRKFRSEFTSREATGVGRFIVKLLVAISVLIGFAGFVNPIRESVFERAKEPLLRWTLEQSLQTKTKAEEFAQVQFPENFFYSDFVQAESGVWITGSAFNPVEADWYGERDPSYQNFIVFITENEFENFSQATENVEEHISQFLSVGKSSELEFSEINLTKTRVSYSRDRSRSPKEFWLYETSFEIFGQHFLIGSLSEDEAHEEEIARMLSDLVKGISESVETSIDAERD